ncbi:hypothetical protein [Paenibacillus sp. KN14-4R]|uniref:hypothetical protein n=1 Tax=Paenibacillus sp. KN14-4R TaxID=3445773 RepID=UPI003F9FEB96
MNGDDVVILHNLITFPAWLYYIIARLQKHDASYNEFIFSTALLLYLVLNLIQAQSFEHKTLFSLIFIVFSLFAIPFHIWLIMNDRKGARKKNEN